MESVYPPETAKTQMFFYMESKYISCFDYCYFGISCYTQKKFNPNTDS